MRLVGGDALDLLTPRRYGERGYPHEEWRALRESAPVCRIEHPSTEPYWAVTTQEWIRSVSTQPTRFTQQPTITVRQRAQEGKTPQARTIVHMDPPEHAVYRRVAARTFTPRSIGRFDEAITGIARSILDTELAAGDGVVDFVDTVASWHPLRVISEIMGIHAEDQGDLLRYTNLVLASTDPEFRAGEDIAASVTEGLQGFFGYMGALAADRRACPVGDLASVLAAAEIDGAPMRDTELIAYYLAMLTAGHDTTRNALSGGLLALLQHPEQLAELRSTDDREIWATAANEILRWTSVVVHFARTAQEDCTIDGQEIQAGDRLALFYPSANRDAEVYDAPDEFRIDRDPNPHLAFGYGEHYCIGQALARLEIEILLREFLHRVTDCELAGPVQHLSTSFVSGVKHLPLRYRLG